MMMVTTVFLSIKKTNERERRRLIPLISLSLKVYIRAGSLSLVRCSVFSRRGENELSLSSSLSFSLSLAYGSQPH